MGSFFTADLKDGMNTSKRASAKFQLGCGNHGNHVSACLNQKEKYEIKEKLMSKIYVEKQEFSDIIRQEYYALKLKYCP